ncbi:MAG: right-handed parallel beta-helix repeat-containing protein [Amaricoccus sp.]
MATVTVSSSAGLLTALKSAQPDTTFELKTGTYALSLRNLDLKGATITAAQGADVSFTSATLNSVQHLTFDGVDFAAAGGERKLFAAANSADITVRNATLDGQSDAKGFGTGVGVWVNKMEGFTLENSHIEGFTTGSWLGATTGLTVRNNTYTDISLDGMMVGGIHDGLIQGNDIDLNVPAGTKHTDGIQFYNTNHNDPLSNVVVKANVIATHNNYSHGIFMANALGDQTGDASTYYRDITIADNVIVSAQVSGIAVGRTIGLTIDGNTILQDANFRSDTIGKTPVIRVSQASTQVSITDNFTHVAPAASVANWQKVKSGPPADWIIENNQIVARGTTIDHLPDPKPDPDPTPPTVGNGQADTFRFSSAPGSTDVADRVNFDEGDVIRLENYRGGTFFGQKGGNLLIVTIHGAVIDSLADLRELQAASPKVHVSDGGDNSLVLDIEQRSGVHSIHLPGLAHAYFDLG